MSGSLLIISDSIIALKLSCSILFKTLFEVLPQVSQITFGGGPYRLSNKGISLSFEIKIAFAFLAAINIISSSAFINCNILVLAALTPKISIRHLAIAEEI